MLFDAPVVEPVLGAAETELARLRNEARAELLRSGTAISIEQLAEGRRVAAQAARQWVARHRQAGRLVTVSHSGLVLIPLFQLDEAFDLRPAATRVVEHLTAGGLSAWAVWDWVLTPNTWLDHERPIDLLDSAPASIDLAMASLLPG